MRGDEGPRPDGGHPRIGDTRPGERGDGVTFRTDGGPTADDRAQSAHDFALGMGVFLLAVAVVFATLPTLATPYEDDAADERQLRAQRVAATALDHFVAGEAATRLDPARSADFFRDHTTGESLRRFFGLPDRASVNVSVRNGSRVATARAADGTDVTLSAGDESGDRRTTTAVRVVTVGGDPTCRPACRLVVRLW